MPPPNPATTHQAETQNGQEHSARLREQWQNIQSILSFESPLDKRAEDILKSVEPEILTTAIKYENDYIDVLRAQSALEHAEMEANRRREIVNHRQMNYHASWEYISQHLDEFIPRIHKSFGNGTDTHASLVNKLIRLLERVKDIEEYKMEPELVCRMSRVDSH